MAHAPDAPQHPPTGPAQTRPPADTHVASRSQAREVVYRVDESDPGLELGPQRRLDVGSTLGGALAALGALLVLSSLVAAVTGTIGYQSDVEADDLSIGGLIGALVVLFLACVAGGWVAARMARRRGPLHGVLAVSWLVALVAVLAALAAVLGDELDVSERTGLPSWSFPDAFTTGAVIAGIVAIVLALLGGWLGGRLADRRDHDDTVGLVETRRGVSERPGGITGRRDRGDRA